MLLLLLLIRSRIDDLLVTANRRKKNNAGLFPFLPCLERVILRHARGAVCAYFSPLLFSSLSPFESASDVVVLVHTRSTGVVSEIFENRVRDVCLYFFRYVNSEQAILVSEVRDEGERKRIRSLVTIDLIRGSQWVEDIGLWQRRCTLPVRH